MSVLLSCDVECLWDNVMLGYISYPVRAFVSEPTMVFQVLILFVMLQQYIGGRFRGVRSLQDGMGQNIV